MKMSPVELHCHSTASDGTCAPSEVAELAARGGLSALALTDHDTTAGLAECQQACARLGVDFLNGIEISAENPYGTMHLLGYGISSASPVLADLTRRLIEGRNVRNPRIVGRLQELGLAISMEEVEQHAGGEVVGRPHIAGVLVKKGYVSSINEAFNEYLAPGGKAYFDKERLSSAQAIAMIGKSGGLAVLAHPVQLNCSNDAQLETTVKNLVDQGLSGLEVLHSSHTAEEAAKYTRLADRFGLLKTGGSDFHGSNKPNVQLGRAANQLVPRAWFDRLRERLGQ